MTGARILTVTPNSPADIAGLSTGDELLSVNGEVLTDVIRYQIATDGAELECEIRSGGLTRTLEIQKQIGEPLGITLTNPVFDRIRTCDNHCPFCFIYQLPPGMRSSLSIKDDDYRLSFLYGNFTTLTRFTELDFERVVTERLSPLNVSIHATDPEVRTVLLRNGRGASSLRWLGALLDAGIEIHGQIVVCPDINNGLVFEDTMATLLGEFSELASVGVVPLGISAFNREATMRAHTQEEAVAVLDSIRYWQSVAQEQLDRRFVFASDEYYLMSKQEFPALEEYEGAPQYENGIGMAATLLAELDAGSTTGESVPVERSQRHGGFFQSVDGAGPFQYRSARDIAEATSDSPVPGEGPIRILTGTFGAQVLGLRQEVLQAHTTQPLEIVEVSNSFFGGTTAVTGLVTAGDLCKVMEAFPAPGRWLLPDVMLNNGVFLDDKSLDDLPVPVEVIPTSGIALLEAIAS